MINDIVGIDTPLIKAFGKVLMSRYVGRIRFFDE